MCPNGRSGSDAERPHMPALRSSGSSLFSPRRHGPARTRAPQPDLLDLIAQKHTKRADRTEGYKLKIHQLCPTEGEFFQNNPRLVCVSDVHQEYDSALILLYKPLVDLPVEVHEHRRPDFVRQHPLPVSRLGLFGEAADGENLCCQNGAWRRLAATFSCGWSLSIRHTWPNHQGD